MKRTLILVLAGLLAAALTGCGGEGGGGGGGIGPPPPPPPPPTQQYRGGVAYALADQCAYAVATIATRETSSSLAQSRARQSCISTVASQPLPGGGLRPSCSSGSFSQCAAVAAGYNSSTRRCQIRADSASTFSAATSSALRNCGSRVGSACQVLSAACSTSAAPGPVVRRLVSGPPPPQPPPPPPGPNMSIRDFNVSLSSSCARQVQVCVSDHQCEDGDRIRVTVNGSTVFSGELFNREHCVAVPVRAGSNSIQLTALNGTGFKGSCDHSDVNTGRIRVVGTTTATQSWSHSGGTGSSANLNVTVGSSGGSCPGGGGGPGPGTSRLYGSVFGSLANNCSSRHGGIAANFNSQSAARTAALNQCRSAGGTSCSRISDFGSAYVGNTPCGALSYGRSSTRCILRAGRGSSKSAAETNALSSCRSEGSGFSCSLLPASDGSQFALCTN